MTSQIEVVISPAGFGYIPINLEANVRRAAAETFKSDDIDMFMRQPNPRLGGATPTALAQTKDGYRKVMAYLESLKDGAWW